MFRVILFYVGLFSAVYLVSYLIQTYRNRSSVDGKSIPKPRIKRQGENWVQVYDTDSLDEAKSYLARLEEEDLDCILYEQGRKDVHGNLLKGYGIAVPRSSTSRAQSVISRIPV